MANLKTLDTQNLSKKKLKKRKYLNTDVTDEEPNKYQKLVPNEKSLRKSTQKREKSSNISNDTQKKNKINKFSTENPNDDGSNNDDDNEDDIRQPTMHELAESEKPENNLNIITIRQKKKQNHKKIIEQKCVKSDQKEIEKNQTYLQTWKNQRDKWKFEKLRQISIQNSIFDKEKISNELWTIALEYLSSTKGSSRDNLIQSAEKQIKELDEEIERSQKKNLINDVRYKRARELLQML